MPEKKASMKTKSKKALKTVASVLEGESSGRVNKKKKTKSGLNPRLMSSMKSVSLSPPSEERDEDISDSRDNTEAKHVEKSNTRDLHNPPDIQEKRTSSTLGDEKFNKEQNERTIFVGNVDISCGKRKLKTFFSKYGTVESVRIRSIAPAQPDVSKKEAAIKHIIHPSRTTCNAYVRFEKKDMMEAALIANGEIMLDHHLRVDRAIPQTSQNRGCSVFVGNLPFECEEEMLYRHFEDCGKIDNVRIIRDGKFSSGKGFGYVNFKSSDAVEVALQLDSRQFMTRELRIQRCVKKVKQFRREEKSVPKEGQKIGFMKLKGNSKMSLKFMKNQKKSVTRNNVSDRKNAHKATTGMKKFSNKFSGKKMMENKKFKKVKKSRQRLNKEERRKIFVSRHLTGAKPMKKN